MLDRPRLLPRMRLALWSGHAALVCALVFACTGRIGDAGSSVSLNGGSGSSSGAGGVDREQQRGHRACRGRTAAPP